MKRLFDMVQVTPEEVKNSTNREYNAQAWDDKVTDMGIYQDVVFYKREGLNSYGSESFYVVYTIDEGIRMIKKMTYSASMTNSLFVCYCILPVYNEETQDIEQGKVTLYRQTPEGFGFDEKPDLRKTLSKASADDTTICFARFLDIH